MKEGEIETQKLPCKLTQGERELKTQELVRLEQDERAKKDTKKAAVAVMNGDLKQVRADIDERVKELHEGTELRDVEVEQVYHYDKSKVDSVRRDTGEVISSREMDSYDRQETLPGDEDLLPPPKKPQKRNRKKRGELTDVPDSVA
jgi:hypothetical protein